VTEPSADTDAAGILRAAFDALEDPVMLYDRERIVFANAAAHDALGASTPRELVGRNVEGFLPPEMREVSDARRSYIIDSGLTLTNLPVKVVRTDGEIVQFNVDIRPVSYNGSTVAMVTLAR